MHEEKQARTPSIPDLHYSLNILNSELKQAKINQNPKIIADAIKDIKTNLDHTYNIKLYGMSALQRLFSHSMFRSAGVPMKKEAYDLIKWFTGTYHPNPFPGRDNNSFRILIFNREYRALSIILSNMKVVDDKDFKNPGKIYFTHDYIAESLMSNDRFELMTGGYICKLPLLHHDRFQMTTLHSNLVLALAFFIQAAKQGSDDAWREIELLLKHTQLKAVSTFESFHAACFKIYVDLLYASKYTHFTSQSLNFIRDCMKEPQTSIIYGELLELLNKNDARANYLKAEVWFPESKEDTNARRLEKKLQQLTLYLQATLRKHPKALTKFVEGLDHLGENFSTTQKEDALDYIHFFSGICSMMNENFLLLKEQTQIVKLIEICWKIHTQISSLPVHEELHKNIYSFYQKVLEQPEIKQTNLPSASYEQLIEIIPILENPPISMSDLKNLIPAQIKRIDELLILDFDIFTDPQRHKDKTEEFNQLLENQVEIAKLLKLNIFSRFRQEPSPQLDLDQKEQKLSDHWKPSMLVSSQSSSSSSSIRSSENPCSSSSSSSSSLSNS